MNEYREKLPIDKTNLDAELSMQAATYLYVAEKSIQAETDYETFKTKVGELEAQLDGKYRVEFDTAKKKITEAGIKGEIERNPDYIKSQRLLLDLRARREVARALKEAWYMRKDLLIQLAIKSRSEIEAHLAETVKAAA